MLSERETVKIPDLSGIEQSKADKILTELGLEFKKSGEQSNEKFPAGSVIKQLPKANSVVKVGRRIFCTVSKGKESVVVPYIIGKNLRTASVLLMKMGLFIGDINYAYSDLYGTDTIIDQSRASGANLLFGDTLNVTVSKGSERQVIVPKLTEMTFEEAKKTLLTFELKLELTNYASHSTYLPNTVISQTPSPGELVPKNSSVVLTISK